MPTTRRPRRGSLQYWPRKRAKKVFARVRSWNKSNDVKLLGFAGYKAGMTHCIIIDNNQNSKTKGQDISIPVTVIECPPLKLFSVRFYKKTKYGLQISSEIISKELDKEISRKVSTPKKETKKIEDFEKELETFDDIRAVVYTQPKLIGLKKKPEIFEVHLGGSLKDKFDYCKNNLGKEIKVDSILKEGSQVDIHSITKGKGVQGAVKRFGVKIRQHKSEKTKRGAGNLGAWTPKHTSWRIPQAGKMGYHLRTEYNKWLIKIGDKADRINPKGGFLKYGLIKNQYVILKGTIPGPSKRLIRINQAIRENKKIPKEAPTIAYISTKSKQGN